TEIVMIDILDQTGRLVVSEQVSVNGSSMNLNMSVNDLANGMYNVRITMNGVSQVERLVIQK
ncbi:MAG: T9SS type A sorting domain-containing protein, partial [Flavobacteriales bacterium]|nr:T9SS type A sorting domain-containing protein [Flavobacteriales bacterium]